MSTDREPPVTAKLLHLMFISTFWGMQIWVTFIAGFVMDNNLNRHTFGFIQSRLFPFYLHIGSACAFFNLAIFAMYHPSNMLDDKEAFQVFRTYCIVPRYGGKIQKLRTTIMSFQIAILKNLDLSGPYDLSSL
ncbi:transmembrane protein 205-like [Cyprinus carpio]|uniref:Transmembrane protein 205-like n=1 Tax=Cyprinus carpio TaxID=7962 RepID=A0A9Q9XKA7_CYPCA|nr:transmembrane protein 205-like [Cyprinus carpio]